MAFLRPQLVLTQEASLQQLLVDPTNALAVGADPQALLLPGASRAAKKAAASPAHAR